MIGFHVTPKDVAIQNKYLARYIQFPSSYSNPYLFLLPSIGSRLLFIEIS